MANLSPIGNYLIMSSRIDSLLAKMRALETELEAAFHEREDEFVYQIKGRRVRFERRVKTAHRQMKIRWADYLNTHRHGIYCLHHLFTR